MTNREATAAPEGACKGAAHSSRVEAGEAGEIRQRWGGLWSKPQKKSLIMVDELQRGQRKQMLTAKAFQLLLSQVAWKGFLKVNLSHVRAEESEMLLRKDGERTGRPLAPTGPSLKLHLLAQDPSTSPPLPF